MAACRLMRCSLFTPVATSEPAHLGLCGDRQGFNLVLGVCWQVRYALRLAGQPALGGAEAARCHRAGHPAGPAPAALGRGHLGPCASPTPSARNTLPTFLLAPPHCRESPRIGSGLHFDTRVSAADKRTGGVGFGRPWTRTANRWCRRRWISSSLTGPAAGGGGPPS